MLTVYSIYALTSLWASSNFNLSPRNLVNCENEQLSLFYRHVKSNLGECIKLNMSKVYQSSDLRAFNLNYELLGLSDCHRDISLYSSPRLSSQSLCFSVVFLLTPSYQMSEAAHSLRLLFYFSFSLSLCPLGVLFLLPIIICQRPVSLSNLSSIIKSALKTLENH